MNVGESWSSVARTLGIALALTAAPPMTQWTSVWAQEFAERGSAPPVQSLALAIPGDRAAASVASKEATRPEAPKPVAVRRVEELSGVASPSPVIDSTSVAEKVARLRKSLDADQRRLSELQASIQDTNGNFARSEEEFRKVDQQVSDLKVSLARFEKEGDKATVGQIEQQLREVLEAREKAKMRFDAAITERRTTQEAVQNIELKIRSDQEALDKLLGQAPAAPAPMPEATLPVSTPVVAPPGVVPSGSAAAPVPAPPPPTTVADLLQSAQGMKPVAPPPPPSAVLPGASLPSTTPSVLPPAAAAAPATGAGPAVLPAGVAQPNKIASKALREAAVLAQRTAEEAKQAEQEAQTLTERMELLRKSIDAERKLRDAAHQRADEADALVQSTSDEMHRALLEGRDTGDILVRLQEVEDRRREARREARRTATHLDELQTEFARLQNEQITALEEAQRKRDAADEALKRVETLQNPFSPQNLLQWVVDHGPRVLGVLFAIVATLWLSRVLGRRIIGLLVGRGLRDSLEERENRAHTLAGVIHNAVNVGAVAVGLVTILDEVGVPVGPVMGGAAVLGLAVAFGAQSLIKDYFTGFMLLVEQQYLVNDVVRIGEITGQVERISLRMTVLRDLEGQAHFIPHGQITTVSNMTHSWSRAVFAVNVSYRENVDRVIDELICLAREIRNDPQFGRLILEDVNMLGVDKLADSAVIIKFFLKTRAQQQWTVKRELLRRIKNRFDELGIEIPYPQQTVYVRESQPLRGISSEAA
ncbi:MAG: mechanosensitive ion channel [Pirellulales bacterium]